MGGARFGDSCNRLSALWRAQPQSGHSVEDWAASRDLKAKTESGVSCETLMAKLKQPPTTFLGVLQQHVVMGAIQPWGAILGADRSRQEILDRYAALQRRFAAVLAGRDPILFERGRGPLPRFQVRVGAESRAAVNDICKRIHLEPGVTAWSSVIQVARTAGCSVVRMSALGQMAISGHSQGCYYHSENLRRPPIKSDLPYLASFFVPSEPVVVPSRLPV